MGAQIKILPENLQNQIAAGEVVERPASVLKELVENSLDAGGGRIEVWIEQGGQNLIKVQDNGWGLSKDQIPLALCRHATSKIQDIQDLSRISSFGFRGEALPSIAAVSRLSISSIVQGEDSGFKLQAEFGKITDQGPVSLRSGTQVEVRDLFFNTPARLKFLKTTATEARKCQEILQQFALAHCDKEFQLYLAGRINQEFPRKQTLEQRLQRIWPEQIAENMLQVSTRTQDMLISGLTGSPETAQGRPGRIFFFVNKRPVQSRLLQSALKQAYQGRILGREYPQAALFLELDPAQLDVNVHPAKLEVRFRDEQGVFRLVHRAVSKALDKSPEILSPDLGQGSGKQENRSGPKYKFQTFEEFAGLDLEEAKHDYICTGNSLPEQIHNLDNNAAKPEPALQKAREPSSVCPQNHKYLGQLDRTYLLIQKGEQALLCLDQHAAHERVLFNRFRNRAQTFASQRLGMHMQLNLHPQEHKCLEQAASYLHSSGFAFFRPDKYTLVLQAIPDFMSPEEAKSFLRQVLQERLDSMDSLWCSLACRQAVKAGEALNPNEACQLIQSWLECADRDYCPHGRPVLVRLDSKDLARMFKRS